MRGLIGTQQSGEFTGFPLTVLIPLFCVLTSVLASYSVSSSYCICTELFALEMRLALRTHTFDQADIMPVPA
jgi:hypothetical protein